MKSLTDQRRVSMLRKMIEIRLFERKAMELYRENLVAGYLHPSIGLEATAVGAVYALEEGDYILTTHRGHGHLLAKGCDPGRMFAELLGRRDGYCRGLGGSMHIADMSRGVLGAIGIVSAGLAIAAGAGLAIKTKGTREVVLVVFGEGATNNGVFHEALNMAAVWKLPVVFLCENNLYAIATRISDVTAVERVADRAPAYGIPAVTADGTRVEEVHACVGEAVARARAGEGPSLVEAMNYKWEAHSAIDPGSYRPKEEVERWLKRCPIRLYREELVSSGPVDDAYVDDMEGKVARTIDDAARFARESPLMERKEFLKDFPPERT